MQKIKGLILLALGVFSIAGVGAYTAQATDVGHSLAMPGGGDWEPEPENGSYRTSPTVQVTSTDLFLAMPGGGDWEPEPENGSYGVSRVTTT